MLSTETKTNDVFILYTALSPIFHQNPILKKGAGKGNESTSRKMTVLTYDTTGEQMVAKQVPVISGNAQRCPARREFIQQVLHRIGLMDGWKYRYIPGDVLLMLLNGGSTGIGTTSRYPSVEGIANVYNELPFFGLFGGCYGQVFFTGRLSVGFALPVIKSMIPLLNVMKSPFQDTVPMSDDVRSWTTKNDDEKLGFVRFAVKGVKSELGIEAFLDAMQEYPEFAAAVAADFQTAEDEGMDKVTLTLSGPIIKGNKELQDKIKGYFRSDKEADALVKKLSTNQMIYFIRDSIPVGSKLHTRISLLPGMGNDEMMVKTFHAYLEVLLKKGYLGGMAAKGFGSVAAEAKFSDGTNFVDKNKANEFWQWVDENRELLCARLQNFDATLFPTK